MKRIFKYAKKYIFELILSSIGAFIFAFGYVMVIFYAFKLLLNLNSISSFDVKMIVFWSISTGIGNAIEHYLGHDIAFKILRDFRILVYKKIRALGPSILDNKDSSKLLQLIGKDIDSIEVFYAHTLVPIIRTITFMIAIFILYLRVNIFMALAITFISIIILILSRNLNLDKIEESSMIYAKENHKMNKLLNQIVNGKDQIIQLGIEEQFFEKIKNKNVDLETYKLEKHKTYNRSNKLINLVYLLGFIIIVYIAKITNNLNKTSLVYLLIYPFIFEPYKSITKLELSLSNGKIAANNLFNFLDEENLIQDGNKSIEKCDNITINALDFSYPNTTNNILENVNLKLAKGEKIGIFGQSGSGKSTLAKVLMRWYPYKFGNIKFDGIELNEICVEDIRKIINYMPQNPDIFSISIRDNLTMFNDKISDEKILDILKKLNLLYRINKLKNGLDTVISKDMFSSGEKQRLDLARSMLTNGQVLILDEPLSNLDTNNEQIVLQYINDNFDGIVIIISHRYEAFSICDSIYEIKDRKIFKKYKK